MTPTIKAVLPSLAAFDAASLGSAPNSGRSLGHAVLWGVGATIIAAVVVWATTLSIDKSKPKGPPPG